MEKLSSGLRINRAGDDAAGLAISEGLKADIRALDQAARNAADGISLVQTGEGALDEVSNILLRMKELAEQSLNGTLSDTDRGYLNAEYSALQSEITRIADATEFNGVKLLDGTGGSVNIQVGIGTTASDSVAVALSTNRDAAALGLTTAIDNATNATTAMGQIDAAIATGHERPFGLRRHPEPAGELDPQHQHDVGEPVGRQQPDPGRGHRDGDLAHDQLPDPAAGGRLDAGPGQHDQRPGHGPARVGLDRGAPPRGAPPPPDTEGHQGEVIMASIRSPPEGNRLRRSAEIRRKSRAGPAASCPLEAPRPRRRSGHGPRRRRGRWPARSRTPSIAWRRASHEVAFRRDEATNSFVIEVRDLRRRRPIRQYPAGKTAKPAPPDWTNSRVWSSIRSLMKCLDGMT